MPRRRVAITGAAGQLGRQLVRAFLANGDEVLAMHRPEWDITRAGDLDRLVLWQPELIVNSAAWTDVDGCAREPDRALRINSSAAGEVAAAASRAGALVVQISTNEVFDGTLDRPYTEDDFPRPINPYGASKLAGERAVAGASARSLIVRTAWLFGPGGSNFVTKILAASARRVAGGPALRVVNDEWGNPTWTPALAEQLVLLVSHDGLPPVVHMAGEPPATRFDWAVEVLRSAGAELPEPISSAEYPRPSAVPARAILATSLARRLGLGPIEWRVATLDYVSARTA